MELDFYWARDVEKVGPSIVTPPRSSGLAAMRSSVASRSVVGSVVSIVVNFV